MYLISPIFLYVYYKSRRAGIILIDICLMASLTANAIVAYVNDFSAYVPDVRFRFGRKHNAGSFY